MRRVIRMGHSQVLARRQQRKALHALALLAVTGCAILYFIDGPSLTDLALPGGFPWVSDLLARYLIDSPSLGFLADPWGCPWVFGLLARLIAMPLMGLLLLPVLAVATLRGPKWEWHFWAVMWLLWMQVQLETAQGHWVALLLWLIATLCLRELHGIGEGPPRWLLKLRTALAGGLVFSGLALASWTMMHHLAGRTELSFAVARAVFLASAAGAATLLLKGRIADGLGNRAVRSSWRLLGGTALLVLLTVTLTAPWGQLSVPLARPISDCCEALPWNDRLLYFLALVQEHHGAGLSLHSAPARLIWAALRLFSGGLDVLASIVLPMWMFLHLWERLIQRPTTTSGARSIRRIRVGTVWR